MSSPIARERLSFTTKLAFGLGDVGAAVTTNVLVFFLLYFLTEVAHLPPGLAGSILLVGKISDAINDPIIGVLTDRTRTPWGRRLPWIAWGIVPFCLLFLAQWWVPPFGTAGLVAYYILVAVLFNLAYTAVNLPYTALTPDLTQDYHERTSLNSVRFTFSIGGSILSLLLATLVFKHFTEPSQQYWVLGWVTAALALCPTLWCCLGLRERGKLPLLPDRHRHGLGWILTGGAAIALILGGVAIGGGHTFRAILLGLGAALSGMGAWIFLNGRPEPHLLQPMNTNGDRPDAATPHLSWREQWRILIANRPFLYVIALYLCSWLAVQLTASIMPYFVIHVLGLPADRFPLVALAVQGTALLLLFVGSALSRRWDKKTVYFLGVGIWMIAQGGLFFLPPDRPVLLYTLAIMAGCGVSVSYLIPWSMLPDVVDLDELRSGQRREGMFYALMVLLQKMALALGLFVVGQALGWAGFQEGAAVQPASALRAIRWAIGPLPTIFLVLGVLVAIRYPLTQAVHQNILLQLQIRREQQEDRPDPNEGEPSSPL